MFQNKFKKIIFSILLFFSLFFIIGFLGGKVLADECTDKSGDWKCRNIGTESTSTYAGYHCMIGLCSGPNNIICCDKSVVGEICSGSTKCTKQANKECPANTESKGGCAGDDTIKCCVSVASKPPVIIKTCEEGGLCNPLQTDDIITFVGKIIKTALSFIGVLCLCMIIYGGFLWMTSQGSKDQLEKAKGTLTYAILGAVIIFAAYAITFFVIDALTK